MPVNKKQLLRMLKFVAELRKNSYPNSKSFSEKLRIADLEENLNISCSERTVLRDIDVLKQEFKAPLKFDAERNGFYLARNTWEFHCPLLCEELITSSLLGVRLAEDIVPQPLKSYISSSVDNQLANNNSDFLDKAFIESLIIASGIKAMIEPETFKAVFDGWRKREVIEFTYYTPHGAKNSHRILEPHLISFLKGIWYVKGIDLSNNEEIRVFAIHRMKSVKLTGKFFEINKQILENVRRNGLFNYEKFDNIKLQCDASIAFYFYEHQTAKKLKIDRQKDGSLIVVLPPSTEYDAIRWILGESGKIKVLEPEWLREKVVAAGRKIIEVNSMP